MIFEHQRFEIWNPLQHPYRHTLAEFSFTNPALPGVTNIESALNYMLAVLYPQTRPAVDTPAELPLVGNTLNDYRVVYDDGDGKSAGYRWEQREGEASPSWHKIYDMDWGMDSIMTGFLNVTQDLYMWKYGRTDIDADGNPITGIFAGQRIFGGTESGQNLTLDANSEDATGFVQSNNDFRPTVDASFNLGTLNEKWKNLFVSNSAEVGDIAISDGLITSSSGQISFFNNNLLTTGDVGADKFTATTQFSVGTLTISSGAIIDSAGGIDFGTTNLTNVGVITAASGSSFGTLTFADGLITDSTGSIGFGDENLTTTGSLSAGAITGTQLDIDNIRLDANTLSVTDLNGNLNIGANGTGVVNFISAIEALGATFTGTVSVSGQLNADNLRLDGNAITSTNTDGDISISPNGAGLITASATVKPSADAAKDLGTTTARWRDLYLSGGVSDGTLTTAVNVILSLRDILSGIDIGYSLFWDGSKFVSSAPDTEIEHATLSGLTTGDSGHTQFAMLAGRAGGQTLSGGNTASDNLILESTTDAAKGRVFTKDIFAPFVSASYSGGWTGVDLGDGTHYFRDLYTKGELKGARFENFTFPSIPASSAQNIGRMVYTTDQQKVYVDTGAGWKVAGGSKFESDVAFDGTQTTNNIDVSASITDARKTVWQLLDNMNDFERIYCTIKATSAANVLVSTSVPLPAGNYRLIGLE